MMLPTRIPDTLLSGGLQEVKEQEAVVCTRNLFPLRFDLTWAHKRK